MRKDETDVWGAAERVAFQITDDAAGYIEIVFHDAVDHAGLKRATAAGRRGMRIDNGLAPVELFVYGRENRVAGPLIAVTRPQADAVGLERIECIFDLAQTSFCVGQRDRRKVSKAPGIVSDQLLRVVVILARQFARPLGLVG